MFGYKKKIKKLNDQVRIIENRLHAMIDVHGAEQRVFYDKCQNEITKKASESENKIKQDIDLINFKLENPKPYQLGEIKSGEYKGWIVISSGVKEQRSPITGGFIGHYWSTQIVNKKGETKHI